MAAVAARARREAPSDPVVRGRPSARHPGDGVRVALGLGVLAVALLAVRRDSLTTFERDLFRLVNDLPNWMRWGFVAIMQGGNVVAAFVVAGVALARRARRLALDLAVAGPAAWFAAKAVKDLVGRPRPSGLLTDVAHAGHSAGMGFVSGHTAVAAALATAAGPYLPRRWRRAVWAVAWVVGLARIYEGAHLPLDVVGGAALGWAIGALLHLALGAPHRVPSLADARAALERAGLPADAVHAVSGEAQGSFPFIATVGERQLFVKLLDPEPRDRDALYRLGRFLALRDVREEARLRDALAQAEHEAAMTLIARAAGVRCPAIQRVHRAGDHVWLFEEVVGSRSLAQMGESEVSDSILADAWAQVVVLHNAGLAHRDLVTDNVVVDGDGRAALVDFAHAVSGATAQAQDNDVAELLVSTAQVVGATRAVRAAVGVLGRPRVEDAAPELQPFALTAATRRRLRGSHVLAELRREFSQVDEPGPRASVAALPFLAASVAVLIVAGGPAAVVETLTTGSWRWAGVVALAGISMYVHRAALVVSASGRPLALGRAVVLTAVAEAWRLAGRGELDRAAATAHQLRRAGLRPGETVRAVGEWRALRLIATASLIAAAVAGAAVAGGDVSLSTEAAVVGTLGVALVASGRARPSPAVTLRYHRALPVAFAAALADTTTAALALAAAVKVVGGGAAVGSVVLVAGVAVGLTVWSSATSGAEELLAVCGLILAGLSASSAVAAALLWRLTTSWGPAALAGMATAGRHHAEV